MSKCGSNINVKKKLFCILSLRAFSMTEKCKGNNAMTTQYMTLVNVSYHQPDVWFCEPSLTIIWCQLCNSCIQIFSDFPNCCSHVNFPSRKNIFLQIIRQDMSGLASKCVSGTMTLSFCSVILPCLTPTCENLLSFLHMPDLKHPTENPLTSRRGNQSLGFRAYCGTHYWPITLHCF